jgi:ABC-type antimicrobial peptide transport system permease subunit
VKHSSLVEDSGRHTVYWHYTQRPDNSFMLTLRAAIASELLATAARDAIARVDPTLALYDLRMMDERVLRSLGPQRTPMVLTLVFAAIAVTLAVVGIYGVLAWSVAQRVGEIGVRMALGARLADIVRLVLRHGVLLIALGLAFGAAGALALGRVLAAQLPEVSAADPWILAGALGVSAVTALVASWVPARRAGRIDPMQALRAE